MNVHGIGPLVVGVVFGMAGFAAAAEPDNAAALVRQLGDEKFERREAATARLVHLGRAAEPALTAAASGDDPEAARRARLLLDRLKYDIPPETPQIVASILVEHFAAPASEPQVTIVRLG